MNLKIYIPIAIMAIIPWGWLLGYVGDWGLQLTGVIVQVVGFALLILLRKKIFQGEK